MNPSYLKTHLLYEWLTASLLFWICLACFETSGTILMKVFPAPLGRGSLPSAVDFHYIVAAFSIYALISIPVALTLWMSEKIFIRLRNRTTRSLFDLNRMDIFLLFGFGILWFKWIANLTPYLTDTEHLPYTPYLLIVPLLALHLWITRQVKKTGHYYKISWTCMILGTILLSKTGYDVFIDSPLSITLRGLLMVSTVVGGICLSLIFCYLLNQVVSRRFKFNRTYALLYALLLSIGLLFTIRTMYPPSHFITSLSTPDIPQNDKTSLPKNVIIVLVDCLRADHLQCYGYTRETSPFLDYLAQTGVIFENCIAPSSWTIPSVVSLFTGVYPQQHGINSFGPIIPEDLVSLQGTLKNNGVITAAFVTNDFLKPRYGYAKGFSHYYDHYLEQEFKDSVASGLFFFNALLHFKNELLYPVSVDPGGTRWWSIGSPPFNHEKRSAGRVTEDALQWMRANRDNPFYLYLHYMDVHSPYDTTWYALFDRKAYNSQDTRERLINTYDGRIAYVDRHIQRIWKALVKLDIAESTLLIITADHGEELYDHQGTGHCTTLYEELIRVPLIMVNSLSPGEGRKVKTQIQLIDLPPTIIDFFGLPVPEQMEGRSLFSLLNSTEANLLPAYALSYTTRGRTSLNTEEGRALWEQKVWDQGIVLESLRSNNEWKIITGNDGRMEFYDLKEDPKETTDVKEVEQSKALDFKERLAEESAELESYVPGEKKIELSPDTQHRLRALGYL